jgi:hypothetical protein
VYEVSRIGDKLKLGAWLSRLRDVLIPSETPRVVWLLHNHGVNRNYFWSGGHVWQEL